MILTHEQALEKLDEIDLTNPEAIKKFIKDVTIEDSTGDVTVLYSGPVNGESSHSVILNIAENENVRIIDNTSAAIVLSSTEFQAKLASSNGISVREMNDRNVGHWTNDLLFNATDGLWAETSKRFAEATEGSVRVISPEPRPGRTFELVELPALLENQQVTDLDGIPMDELRELRNTRGPDTVRDFVFDHSWIQAKISNLGVDNYQQYLSMESGINAHGYGELLKDPEIFNRFDSAISELDSERFDRIRGSLDSVRELGNDLMENGSRIANKLGPVGSVIGFLFVSNQAAAAQEAGDPERAKEIMAEWAADAAGSLVGEAAGATIGGIAVAIAASLGVAISAPIAGAVIIGAAFIGGIFGAEGATGIYDLTKDLDGNGKGEIFDIIGRMIYGDNYTVTTPPPPNLDGIQIGLTTWTSVDDIVANAKESMAWRYALVNLTSLVIHGDDSIYEQHNQNGELNLENFSDEYLRDRATLFMWKQEYVRRGLEFTDDLDTWYINDDWDFVDYSQEDTTGSPLRISIDGFDLSTTENHQILFGSQAGERLDGRSLSDSLYGGAGDDTMVGNQADDYLEGGQGNDTYFFNYGDGDDVIWDVGGNQNNIQFQHEAGQSGYSSIGTLREISSVGRVLASTRLFEEVDGDEVVNPNTSYSLVTRTENDEQVNDLIISINGGEGGTITIRNFGEPDNNRFGIAFEDASNEQPDVGTDVLEIGTGENMFGEDWDWDRTRIESQDWLVPATEEAMLALPMVYDASLYYANHTEGATEQLYFYFWGSDNNDILEGTVHVEHADGLDRTRNGFGDNLRGMDGDDWIYGEQVNEQGVIENPNEGDSDRLYGNKGNDHIFGGAGDDLLIGGSGDDELVGGEGRDVITAGTGSNRVFAGDGGGVIEVLPYISYAVMFGADDYDLPSDSEVRKQLNAFFDEGVTIEYDASDRNTLVGGRGEDWISGGFTDDVIQDLGGESNLISGFTGNDFILTGEGKDQIYSDALFYWFNFNGNGSTYTVVPRHDYDLSVSDKYDDTVDSGGGNDKVVAFAGDDNVHGGEGNDTIVGDIFNDAHANIPDGFEYGELSDEQIRQYFAELDIAYHGDDYIDGGNGDDYLYGNGGDDEIWGGEGKDVLFGDDFILAGEQHGKDKLYGGAGSDTLYGGDGEDILEGGSGTDYLYGDKLKQEFLGVVEGRRDNGSRSFTYKDKAYTQDIEGKKDQLYGGAGNDYIWGDGGDDILVGGTGNDYLYGGEGADHYFFSTGDGRDVIYDDNIGSVTIKGNVFSFEVSGSDVTFGYGNEESPDYITFKDGAFNTITLFTAGSDISTPSDGNDLYIGDDVDDVIETDNEGESIVSAGGGNDTISGGTRQDYLLGGEGNDVLTSMVNVGDSEGDFDYLSGGEGNDTYNVQLGALTQINNTDLSDGFDTLVISEDLSRAVFRREDDHLILARESSPDESSIVIENHFAGSAIDAIQFDDITLDQAGIVNQFSVLSDQADTFIGSNDADDINGLQGDDTLFAEDGNDTLEGGAGNDTLYGGEGDDVYRFNAGDGNDVIIDHKGLNRIVFGDAVANSDVSLRRRYPTDLLVTIISTNETITVSEFFNENSGALNRIEFVDGTVWDANKIVELATQATSEGNDWVGDNSDEELIGSSGADGIYASGGDDSLYGENGNDTLYGGNGNDTLIGGEGNDTLLGGRGNNVYEIGVDDGNDTIDHTEFYGPNNLSQRSTHTSGANTLRFLDGILPEHIVLDFSDKKNLVINNQNTGQVTTVRNFYNRDIYTLAAIEFANGPIWDLHTILAEALPEPTDGDDVIGGFASDDLIYGGAGNDVLSGEEGDDQLFGGTGRDSLYGGAGDDVLDSGTGEDDLMVGGTGFNTYIFEAGDGSVTIDNRDTSDKTLDTLKLVGLNSTDVSVSAVRLPSLAYGFDLELSFASTGDSIVLDNYLRLFNEISTDEFEFIDKSESHIEYIAFADGVVWELSDVLDNTENLPVTVHRYDREAENQVEQSVWGSSRDEEIFTTGGDDKIWGYGGNDLINGGSENDVIYGGSGNDIIYGVTGDDVLYGEEGDDYLEDYRGNNRLIGGAGNDTYRFEGDPEETETAINNFDLDPTSVDKIILSREFSLDNQSAPIVTPNNITLSQDGDDLLIRLDSSNNVLRVENHFEESGNYAIDQITFANDSRVLNQAGIVAVMNGEFNSAPTLPFPFLIGVPTITPGFEFEYSLPDGHFVDPEGDVLIYSALLTDGSELPEWLSFDSTTATFSGTPPIDTNLGNVSIEVTADDGRGGNASTRFSLPIDSANNSPVVANPIADQTFLAGEEVAFSIPGNTFNDPEGHSISYRVSLSNGESLPEWLTYNSTANRFEASPTEENVGTVEVEVTAVDSKNAYVSDRFTWTVNTAAPVLENAIVDQSVDQNSEFSFTLPANTFTDANGDTLSFSASQQNGEALPDWLTFDSTTQTFSGTPTNNDVGTLSITVTADDGNGITASNSFDVLINNVNDAPTANDDTVIGNQNSVIMINVSDLLANDVDIDLGDTLSVRSVENAVNGTVIFDNETGTVSFTPIENYHGDASFDYTLEDALGEVAAGTVNISVQPIDANTPSVESASVIYMGTADADMAAGSNDSDTLNGANGDDNLYGFNGNDTLIGADGYDALYGGKGDDLLQGGSYADTLVGGEGNDDLQGEKGRDVYHIHSGDGHDTILDWDATQAASGVVDRVVFGEGIEPNKIAFTQAGNNLLITLSESQSVTVLGYFVVKEDGSLPVTVREFEFADGTVWRDAEITQAMTYSASDGADKIIGFDFIGDTIYGGFGDDALIGRGGDDLLVGGSGYDTLIGGEGNDTLQGGSYADTLIGGAGDDILQGNKGRDIYQIGLGDGHDVITDWNPDQAKTGVVDTIEFDEGISPADLSASRVGDDLLLTISEEQSIRVEGFFFITNEGVAAVTARRFTFADGTEWNTDDINTSIAYGATEGNDVINGSDTQGDFINAGLGSDEVNGLAGDDVLNGGNDDGAADQLAGGAGSDTYRFVGDFGTDVVNNGDASVDTTDSIEFATASITDLWFSQLGDDLVVTQAGTANTVTLTDWYVADENQVDQFEAEDAVLTNNMIEQLVSAMASYDVPFGEGADIPQQTREELAPVMAEVWQV